MLVFHGAVNNSVFCFACGIIAPAAARAIILNQYKNSSFIINLEDSHGLCIGIGFNDAIERAVCARTHTNC